MTNRATEIYFNMKKMFKDTPTRAADHSSHTKRECMRERIARPPQCMEERPSFAWQTLCLVLVVCVQMHSGQVS